MKEQHTIFSLLRMMAVLIPTTLVSTLSSQFAMAQCPNPSGLATLNIAHITASLRWNSNNTPTDNCWVVTLGGSGMVVNAANCPDGGQGLFTTTVCYINNVVSFSAPVTGMSVSGTQITINVSGLQPGTTYKWYVAETCDGIAPPFNVSGCAGSGIFQTIEPQPYTWASTSVQPSCPFNSPGYVANGSLIVSITDGSPCNGTYTVTATPVVGSGPGGSTPPNTTIVNYVGYPAGNFLFENAGVGCYNVSVIETSNCNLPATTIVDQACVPDGMDMAPPFFYIIDFLGNNVADNDPQTPQITTYTACGSVENMFYILGFDLCDGPITAQNAVSATVSTIQPPMNPTTQVNVTNFGGGYYLLEVEWGEGEDAITVLGHDAAGNTTSLTLTQYVPGSMDPVITITGNSQYTIPICTTSVSDIFRFTVNNYCDQSEVNFNNLIVNFGGANGVLNFTGNNYRDYLLTFPNAGSYLISASYIDQFGNEGAVEQVINVQLATTDLPPVILTSAKQVNLAACQNSASIIYSFTISDDCAPINIAQVQFNGGGSGLPNLNGGGFYFTDQVGGPNNVYFEVIGTVTPGTFFPLITYQGVTANPTITVWQNANQPADIILPVNLTFTVPQCQTSVEATTSITIIDDCDNPIVPARASFTLGGVPLIPSFINAAAGYFEFTLNLTQAANDGDLLVAWYQDAQGAVRLVDNVITVHAQPDNWAPIIVYPAQDIIIELGPCEQGTTIVTFEASATDNCGVASFIAIEGPYPYNGPEVPMEGGLFTYLATPGTHTITLTATDIYGNVRQEDFRIIVNQQLDNTPPNALCFDQTITFNGESNIPLNSSDLATASDNCGIQNITLSTDNLSCAQIGQIVPVTVTATDYNNNSASCVAQVTVSGLPCGWSSYNGAVGCGSSSAYNPTTGVWSLTGSNCYYTTPYTSDILAFAQHSICGNGSITALVTGTNGTSLGWAGVIMRESNALGAKKAQLMTNLSSLHRRELRVVTNGQAFPQQFASNGRYWLRIVRQGNQFTGYASANGMDWIPVMAQIIAMNACIEIGLVVTNYQQNSTVTATFSNVSYTENGSQGLMAVSTGSITESTTKELTFTVFPNPTTGEVNLDLNAYSGRPVRIELYTPQGLQLRYVEVQEVQIAIERLDLSTYANGMYWIKVKTPGLPDTTKRVVLVGNSDK